MKKTEAVAVARTIQLRNPALNALKLTVVPVRGRPLVRVTLDYMPADRDYGDEGEFIIVTSSDLWAVEEMTASTFIHKVAELVKGAFVHEFHECFHVDGVRLLDPHGPWLGVP